MSYVLDAGKSAHGMDALSERWLNHKTIHYGDVAGTGKSQVCFDQVTIEKATEYAAEDADVTLRLWRVLKPQLVANGLMTVYETLERPLVPVLARMERSGISIDRQVLSRLSGEFAQRAAALEDEIKTLAGGVPLNPGSPKQIGDILFGKMGLGGPNAKKTKTVRGRPRPRSSRISLSKASRFHSVFWTGGRSRSSNRPIRTPCQASSIRARTASTPAMRSPPPRPDGSRPPIPTCRTSRSAPRKGGRSAAPSSPIGLQARVGRLFADRAAPARRDRRHRGAQAGVPRRARHPRHDGVGDVGVPVKGMPGEVRRRAKAINFGIIYGISASGSPTSSASARLMRRPPTSVGAMPSWLASPKAEMP